MKDTKSFVVTAKVHMWEIGDWKDGRLEIPLRPDEYGQAYVSGRGSRLIGWQVFKWEGDTRVPKSLAGELMADKLILMRPPAEDWDGCVTLFLYA